MLRQFCYLSLVSPWVLRILAFGWGIIHPWIGGFDSELTLLAQSGGSLWGLGGGLIWGDQTLSRGCTALGLLPASICFITVCNGDAPCYRLPLVEYTIIKRGRVTVPSSGSDCVMITPTLTLFSPPLHFLLGDYLTHHAAEPASSVASEAPEFSPGMAPC
jgi:hypothetical protein